MRKRIKINLEKVKSLAMSKMTMKEIAREMHLKIQKVRYAIYEKLKTSVIKLKDMGLQRELDKVESGEKFLFQVRADRDQSPRSFYRFIEKLGWQDIYTKNEVSGLSLFDLRESLGQYANPVIDSMILDGKSFADIGREIGHTKQHVEQYVKGTGQYTIWKRKTDKSKQEQIDAKNLEKEEHTKIISALRLDLERRMQVKESDSPKEKAEKTVARVIMSYTTENLSHFNRSRAYKLYLDYFKNESEENKIPYHVFAERNGYNTPAHAAYWLNRAGMGSLLQKKTVHG